MFPPNHQPSLFSHVQDDTNPQVIQLDGDGSQLYFWERFFSPTVAQTYFTQILEQAAWEQSTIVIAGKPVTIPRLNCWYGDPGADYSYSGRLFRAHPWLPVLTVIKQRVDSQIIQQLLGSLGGQGFCGFNSVLCNHYRDGNDSVDWHSDDEPELGDKPFIASVSLGATRTFQLRHKSDRHVAATELPLSHGSLLLMTGEVQHHWQHRVPKLAQSQACTARVNLTFRVVKAYNGRDNS